MSASIVRAVEDKKAPAVLAAIVLALCLLTNLPWQLDDYDQAQQAFTSAEMINDGHWLHQRTPHDLIAQKPPLVGWISAAFFKITHSWDVAWRLPSLLAATAISFALLRAATTAYGPVPGLIAFGAFGLNLLTVRLATLVRTDMPLALTIFLPGLLIFEKILKREAWTFRDRLMFCALLTASLWIKGPFIYVFLLPAIAFYEWHRRSSKLPRAWCGWWPWLVSLILFLPWILMGIEKLPGFYHQVIGFEVLARFNPTVHRSHPVYFYLVHLLHKLFPWSILMLLLCLGQRKEGSKSWWKRLSDCLKRRASSKIVGRAHRLPPAASGSACPTMILGRSFFRQSLSDTSPVTLWLTAWVLSGLIIMSLIPSKRVDRVFAIVPPFCLLLSALVANGLRDARLRSRVLVWSASALLAAIFFSSSYTIWKVTSGYADHADALVAFGREVRAEAQAQHWRYEVISGSSGSEGMLLYLEKANFIEPEEAVRQWNSGALDALLVTANDSGEVLPQLKDAVISPLRSVHRKRHPKVDYLLLLKQPPAVPIAGRGNVSATFPRRTLQRLFT